MQLKLKSNYWEKWFAAFDREGLEFRLMNNEGPDRPTMFEIFKKNDINHPFFGKFNDFIKIKYNKDKKVVIYDDIQSHFGQNKRLLTFSELNTEDKLKYMSEYVELDQKRFTDYLGRSTRYLFIGHSGFTYDYFSYNDWRSNNGKVFISEAVNLQVPAWRKNIPYPMFAIDFVGEQHDLKAIDLNISPGVDSSLYKLISPSMMVLSIKEWLEKYITEKT